MSNQFCALRQYVSILLFLLFSQLFLVQTQDLVAGVSISDGKNKVNQQATYRFTLIPSELSFDSGTVIQTYIPNTVSLVLGSSNSITICRRYIKLTDSTQVLTNCVYDSSLKMIQFTISSNINFDVAFEYELGYLLNPGRSSLVTNFQIAINDKNGNNLYDTTLSSTAVQIYPGDIFDQSLTDSSQKVSDTGTFTFKFQITNSIPGDGQFQITFPNGEISVPAGITNSDTRVKIYDQDWQTGSIIASSNSIYFQGALKNSALAPVSGKYIYIEIQKITNPKSLKQTSSFQISTQDSQFFTIDQTSTLLTVQPTIPGDIVIFSVGPYSSQAVGATTDLNFNIQLPQAYDNGGYLLITFPPEVILTSLTCYPYIGFVTQTSNCAFSSSSPQVVKISNQVSSTRLYFLISSAQNPNSTRPTSTFSIQAYDASNFLMSQILTGVTYTSTPASLKAGKATRSLTQIASSTGNALTVSFTLNNQLYNGDYILLKIPYEQMLLATDTTFSIQANSGSVNTNPAFTLDSNTNSSYFIVSLVSPCSIGCASNSVITLTLSGLKNPEYIQSTYARSIEIYTLTSEQFFRDRRISATFTTPSLTSGPISSIQISRSQFVVNSPTQVSFQFSITTRIPSGGIIRLYFPSSSFYNPSSGSLVCTNLVSSQALSCSSVLNSDSSTGINYIQVSSRCTSGCIPSDIFSINIANLKNKPSVKPIKIAFSVATFTQELYAIDTGNTSIASGMDLLPASFNQLSIIAPVSNIVTGAQTSLQLGITTTNGITQNTGQLIITLPSELRIASSGQICSAKVQSASATLSCTVIYSSNQIKISNPNSNSYSLLQIVVTITNCVINPSTTKSTGSFSFESSILDTATSTYYLVEQDTSSLTFKADTPNQLLNSQVRRSNIQINEATDIEISFTSFNPIPISSSILIGVSKDQVVFREGTQPTLSKSSTGVAISLKSFQNLQSTSSSLAWIEFTEYCSTSSQCPSGTEFQFQITGGYNPSSMKLPTNSFQILIQQEGTYYSDQVVSNLFISPSLTAGQFKSVQFSQTSNVIGALTELNVSVKMNNGISTGKEGSLALILPSNLYYKDDTLEMECYVDEVEVGCEATATDSIFGKAYTQIVSPMNCLSLACSSDQQKVFIIKNLRNRYSRVSYSGVIQMQSSDSDSLAYDSSSIQFSQTSLPANLAESSTLQMITASKSNLVVSESTDVTISFQNSIPFYRAQIIQVQIPKDPFADYDQNIPSISCYIGTPSTQISCSINQQVSDSSNFVVQFVEFCTSSTIQVCEADTLQTLKITGLSNRYNTKSFNAKVQASILTADMQLYETTLATSNIYFKENLLPQSATLNSDISLSNNKVGEQTALSFSFQLNNMVLATDTVKIDFQNGLVYSNSQSSCIISIQNVELKDQECPLTNDADQLVLGLNILLQETISKDSVVMVILNDVVNYSKDKRWSSNVQLTATSTDSSLISQGSVNIDEDILVPNDFSYLLAERTNNELSSSTDLTITYQTPITLLQNSQLTLLIPQSQFVESSTVSGTLNGLDIVVHSISSTSTTYQQYLIPNICSLAKCNADNNYTIKLTGFQNPAQVQAILNSIQLQITSSDNLQIIQQNSQNLEAQPPLKMGSLINLGVAQNSSLTVGDPTNYYIEFQFPNTISTSSQIIITLPTATATNPSTGQIICTNLFKNKKLSCDSTLDSNNFISHITLSKYCLESDCSQEVIQKIQISNLSNVYYQRSRSTSFSISVKAISSAGFVISSGDYQDQKLPDFQVKIIDTFMALRSSVKAGDQNVDLTLSFTTKIIIPEGAVLTYTFPLDQQNLKDPLSLTCTSGSKNLNCIVTSSNSSFVQFKVSEWCSNSCKVGTLMTLVVQRTVNPSVYQSSFETSFGLKISTCTGQMSQQVNSGVIVTPSIESLNFTGIQAYRDNNYVGSSSFIRFQIPLQQYIKDDTDIQITLPSELAFFKLSDSQTCSVFISGWNDQYSCEYKQSSNSTQSGLYPLKSIKIKKVCQSLYPCYIGNDLQIRFSLINSQSTFQSTLPLNLTFWQGTVQIGYGQTINSLLPLIPSNITTTLINSTCVASGQICNIVFQVNTSNPLQSNQNSSSQLEIKSPSQVVYFTNQICSARLLDTKVTCKILNSSYIQVTHNFDTVSEINFVYLITINGIRPPQSTEPSQTFQIASYQKIGLAYYQVDSMKEDFQLSVPSAYNFYSVIVTRSNTNFNQKVNLKLGLTLNNPLPQNSVIKMSVPQNQLVINSDISACLITYLTQTIQPPSCNYSLMNNQFTITNLCNKNGGCSKDQQIIFVLSSDSIHNPSFIKSDLDYYEDSVQVSSSYISSSDFKEYLVDASTEGIFITPQLIPQNLIVEDLHVSSNYTSDYISIEFNLLFQNDSTVFTQDYLQISFKDLTFNKDNYKDLVVYIENQPTEIKSYERINSNDSLKSLTLECSVENCQGRNQFSIKVANLKNPYFKLKNSSITSEYYNLRVLELQYQEGEYISEGFQDLAKHLKNLQISSLQKPQMLQSNKNLSSLSNITISFELYNRPVLSLDSIIQIQLGSNFSAQSTSFKCSDQLNENLLECIYISTNRTAVIKNYFQTTEVAINPQSVSLKLEGIQMPQIQSSQNLSLTILSGARQFVSDSTSFQIEAILTTSQGCDETCSTCQLSNPSVCVSCPSPSLKPILLGTSCVSECPQGYFEKDLACLLCGQNCASCQTLGLCETCDSPGFTLMDGICVNSTDNQTNSTDCPSGTIKNSQGFCVKSDCENLTLQNGTVMNQDCLICGVSGEYCYYCGDDEFSFNGLCVEECPHGYYSNQYNQCKKCNVPCLTCEKQADHCLSCRKEAFSNSKLDLSTNQCVEQCTTSSIESKTDPNICESCSSSCHTCQGESSNCTSCYFDKNSLADLFYYEGQCLEDCPVGYFANYDTHNCEQQNYEFLSFPPIYLASSATLSGLTLMASKLLSGRSDLTSEIGLSIITQIEFFNRIFLFLNLWSSPKTFSFCVTCLSIVGNSFLSIYFATLVLDPILSQIPQSAEGSSSKMFKAIVIVSQISGVNTLRILTSNFFGLSLFSNKFSEIVYYVKQLETISLLSLVLNIFQLCTGISCIFDFGFSQDAMGLGVNSIVLNSVIIAVQVYKYIKVFKILRQYEKVSQM